MGDSGIASRLLEVRQRVEQAAEGRPVRLVAVSKTKPMEDILAAYSAGQRHFGENYAQELVDKAGQLPSDIQWHYIGAIQTNKLKALARVPNLFAVETLDSSRHADALNTAVQAALAGHSQQSMESLESGNSRGMGSSGSGRAEPLRVFVQVNTSGEDSKHGVEPEAALALARHITEQCPALRLAGLMSIGSASADPALDFTRLAEVARQVAEALGAGPLELSMGMSSDFEAAVSTARSLFLSVPVYLHLLSLPSLLSLLHDLGLMDIDSPRKHQRSSWQYDFWGPRIPGQIKTVPLS